MTENPNWTEVLLKLKTQSPRRLRKMEENNNSLRLVSDQEIRLEQEFWDSVNNDKDAYIHDYERDRDYAQRFQDLNDLRRS